MKRERILIESRRNEILAEIKATGRISVDELSSKLSIAPLTVRRDLQHLEDAHRIYRYYGGASPIEDTLGAMDARMRSRELIARYAAGIVEDGENIFINSSMTALGLVKYLGNKRVTVITNNGSIMNMEVPSGVSVVLTGGELRYPKHVMVGEYCISCLQNITVKKSFLGCSGLTAERGMTSANMNEVQLNRLMFEQVTGAAYLLADHTKIGIDSNFVSQSAQGIQNIITDEFADEQVLKKFKEMNASIVRIKLTE